jgi:hypothetical protein
MPRSSLVALVPPGASTVGLTLAFMEGFGVLAAIKGAWRVASWDMNLPLGIGFTGARLYSTMAVWPGTLSVRLESLLGEATLFAAQRISDMIDDAEQMFIRSTGWGSSAVAGSRLVPVLFLQFFI